MGFITTKTVILPGMLAAMFLVGGAHAEAFNMAAFSGFSSNEREAIEEAAEVRREAAEEARRILDDAGIDQEDMQNAIRSYHERLAEDIEQAFEDEDYDDFEDAVEGTPLANGLTEDIFDELLKAYEHYKDGDMNAAREVMFDLRKDEGYISGMLFGLMHKGPLGSRR